VSGGRCCEPSGRYDRYDRDACAASDAAHGIGREQRRHMLDPLANTCPIRNINPSICNACTTVLHRCNNDINAREVEGNNTRLQQHHPSHVVRSDLCEKALHVLSGLFQSGRYLTLTHNDNAH
jgi:hypothetical protein